MKKACLSDICSITMGQSPDSSTYNDNGNGLPFFQGNADFGNRNPHVRVWCSEPKKIAHQDDILISVRAPIGALNIANQECCIGRGLAALSVKTEYCLQEYLWYYLCNAVDELNSKGTGSTFKAINKNVLAELSVRLFDLKVQQRIVLSLNKLTELINQSKRSISKLDELIKSRFVEMFGDLSTNSKAWSIVPLEEVAEIRIGPFGSLLHKENYICNGHALVNPSHIIDSRIIPDVKLTISDTKYHEMLAYHLRKDDIVLGRRGEMGRCAVVQEKGLLCGTGSMIIRPNGKLKSYFLQTILSSPLYKKILEDKAVGVTMLNLNVPIVSSVAIPLLPVDLQDEFIALLQTVEQQKATVQKSIDKLETLKKSLMQEYFG